MRDRTAAEAGELRRAGSDPTRQRLGESAAAVGGRSAIHERAGPPGQGVRRTAPCHAGGDWPLRSGVPASRQTAMTIVRQATRADLPAMVDAHIAAFPGFTLTV